MWVWLLLQNCTHPLSLVGCYLKNAIVIIFCELRDVCTFANMGHLSPQGHLVGGYVYVMWTMQVHPISWTIPHCVLVLKLIG